MGKKTIKRKDLKHLNLSNKVSSLFIGTANQKFKKESKDLVLILIKKVLDHPENYLEDEIWSKVAKFLYVDPNFKVIDLKEEKAPLKIFGELEIEEQAKHQIYTALKLPVAVKGALMPDAHYGYGLPIGGVLATQNAVIPYGVGVDIGCRMALTVYDIPVEDLDRKRHEYTKILKENTKFGMREEHVNQVDQPIFYRDEFKEIPFIKKMKGKAMKQMGSSGGGNHFVEFGVVELSKFPNKWDLPVGRYLGILTHSGSRGLGATIATHYSKLAMEKCPLPKIAAHLAFLDLDSEEGQEYWLGMNLAGDYAKACHDDIHRRLAKAIGAKPLFKIENHHNFAWKEMVNGEELIVHRKGATPAGKNVYGIIPSSMATSGFIVRGKGNEDAINSASHGAGRLMSRRAAKNATTRNDMKSMLKNEGITLIGGDVDESPIAYKDINRVMNSQMELVDIVGKFYPKIVRMAN